MPTIKFRDEQILSAMESLLADGMFPTLRALMRKTGIESTGTISRRLQLLAGKRKLNRYRSDRGYIFLPMRVSNGERS